MRTFSSVNRVILLACIIAFFTSADGCHGNEMNVGYYYIEVPGYETGDYYKMLQSSNREEQYNALACLSFEYRDQKVLKYDSLKGTGPYDTALLIYKKAMELTKSADSWVSSAAFRLLGSMELDGKDSGYYQYLLSNRNPSLNVQLEQFIQIINNSEWEFNPLLLESKMDFYRKHPSWLLQKAARQLLITGDSATMLHVMNEYRTAKDEIDKRLLLQALLLHMNPTVFDFLANEWQTTKDERIKAMIQQSLPTASNQQQVINWYAQHTQELFKQMPAFITDGFAGAADSPVFSKLIVLALEKGWKPSSLLVKSDEPRFNGTPKLYYYLLESKYNRNIHPDSIAEQQPANSKRVEQALLRNHEWNKEWQIFEEQHKTHLLPAALITAHRQLTELYVKQTRMLMQQYGIDSVYYKELIRAVTEQSKWMYKEPVRGH